MSPIYKWTDAFPKAPPIGYALRRVYKSNWTRFHGLPGAKRLPDTDSEMSQVLFRYNVIASVLFGLGSPLTMWLVYYGVPTKLRKQFWTRAKDLPGNVDSDPDVVEKTANATIWQADSTWLPGRFDPEFRQAATGDIGY